MNAALAMLADLVRIPSQSSLSNRPIVDYARSVLEPAGWKMLEWNYRDQAGVEKVNLIAAPPGQDPGDPLAELALLCHTDTVPPEPGWAAALEPRLEDGLLHGCGACDVKGFLACLLKAAGHTPPAGFRPGLRLALTADEEVGCVGAHRLFAAGRLRPRTLLIGEPTSLHPAIAGKGYCLGEIAVFGAAAHSAHSEQGHSAIFDAARVLQAVEQLGIEFAAQTHPGGWSLFNPPVTTCNIGRIEGGTAKNVVPAECRFPLEWRPMPGASFHAFPGRLRTLLAELHQRHPRLRCEFTLLREQQGFATPPGSPLVRGIVQHTGKAPAAISFGSEAGVFAETAEEIVVFGPGEMRTAHSARECVPVDELREASCCLKALMQA